MPLGSASKIRGNFSRLDAVLLGQPCRGALAALAERQSDKYAKVLTGNLDPTLQFPGAAAILVPERPMSNLLSNSAPAIIYTDCSTREWCALAAGAVVIWKGIRFVGSWDIPMTVDEHWLERKTYINLVEPAAAPILVFNFPWIFEDADVIWFIDNRAALSHLITGAASSADAAEIALRVQLLLVHARARVCYEYVDSDANASDVFSRDFEIDEDITTRIAEGSWRWLGGADLSPLTAATLADLFRMIATLGGWSSRLQRPPARM